MCKRYLATSLMAAFACHAQSDPGPRPGRSGSGSPYPTLSQAEVQYFLTAIQRFTEVDSVSGQLESGKGLGPTFNGNSCAMCHSQPAFGGSSPGLKSPQNSVPNPQVALATLHGATNTIPSFITAEGPVREARFIHSTTNSNIQDGGVHGLFTIKGRSDAPGCAATQPDFAGQLASNNVIFRIPTPVFGAGLVETTPDATLQANLTSNPTTKALLGISGRLNTNGNDGTVTRFGWKAQNKSLLIFAGEAYNVEQGVTNEIFPTERGATAACTFNSSPEDDTDSSGTAAASALTSADTTDFAAYMRLLAPPLPTTASASELRGQSLFASVGCSVCHSVSLTSGRSPYTGMSNVVYHPYSDFALHHMGSTLADGISQGTAGPDEFRTAPLWGLGQRLFFLHDGRTADLSAAIGAHFSSPLNCTFSNSSQLFLVNGQLMIPGASTNTCGSEANTVVTLYNLLPASQKQDLLNFLRSL